MSKHEEATTESSSKESGTPGLLLAAGLAIGLGAAAWFLSKRHSHALNWSTDSILDACDAAAAKMEEILHGESGHRNVG